MADLEVTEPVENEQQFWHGEQACRMAFPSRVALVSIADQLTLPSPERHPFHPLSYPRISRRRFAVMARIGRDRAGTLSRR